jgi:GAF domain-containing protein
MLQPGWPRRLLSVGDGAEARIARLCELCLDGLDVDGVSVQLVADGPYRVGVHVTDPVAGRLDDLQQELGEGPAVDAVRTPGPVLEPDLRRGGEVRWPWFAPAAVQLGIGAVFAVPIQVGATTTGVLGLCRRLPGPLDRHELADAVVLADAAGIALLNEPALGSAEAMIWLITDSTRFRPEIHQATGMLTVQLGLGTLDAFARLCATAYADGRPMMAVARDIVAGRLRLDRP